MQAPTSCCRRSLVETVGYLLPALEVVVGLALVLGVLTRGAAAISALLFVAFIIGIASVWARGMEIDCGCFGGGGANPDASSDYPWEIARDVGLLLLSGFLVWQRKTRLALDSVLFRRRTPEDLEAELDNDLTTTEKAFDVHQEDQGRGARRAGGRAAAGAASARAPPQPDHGRRRRAGAGRAWWSSAS